MPIGYKHYDDVPVVVAVVPGGLHQRPDLWRHSTGHGASAGSCLSLEALMIRAGVSGDAVAPGPPLD